METEHDTNMKLTERLFAYERNLTSSEWGIAAHLLHNYPVSLLQNASEIASALNINIATVTRFFTKLGYASVKEATKEFKKEITSFISSPVDRYSQQNKACFHANKNADFIKNVAELDSENIYVTLSCINVQMLQELATNIFHKYKKVFIIATMKSFAVASYLYASLSVFRENVFIYQNTNPSEFMLNFDEDALCIFVDFRRSTKLNKKMVEYAKEKKSTIVSISDSKLSPTSILANYQFIISTKSSTMFDSYTAALSFVNLFFKCIIQEHGEEIYKRYTNLEEIYQTLDVFLNAQKECSQFFSDVIS